MVNSWVFKGEESESEVKTNSGPRVCSLLVDGPHFAYVEHAQCPLLAHCVNTHTHTPTRNFSTKRTRIFLHTLLERADHQYLNDRHLACKVRTGIYEVLTESGLSFVYKMIQEIISMPRVDSGYPHNFAINSWVFKDDKSETETKTNNGHFVCPLLAYTEYAQRPFLAFCVSTHRCAHASLNLCTLVMAKIGGCQYFLQNIDFVFCFLL